MTIEMAFGILMSVAAAAIGLSIKRLFAQIDEQQKTINQMQVQYKTRVDAQQDNQQLLKSLERIENKIEKMSEKLDRKADKP
ncbi:hypothetical protein [Vitreoscilla stercoraria]|uniref:Uncharacterized protein n=1 Tax=Vitreoscilla stercoraria TaxID=61 RepID=A0ABY4ECW5_VITST|nr:hypothetical protein [Vitreoscilla stercoraria]UOO93594.1 hypothetical protein LVJ81_06105 [Vitreoscilla stercoraria]